MEISTPKKLIFQLRNVFESSQGANRLLDLVTNNFLYRRLTYMMFERKVSEIKKEKSYLFAIEVSSFCNARCFFCPNSFMKRRKNNLGMEVFLKLVERIKEEKIKPRSFNLTGTGEPLLDKTLLDKVEILKDNFPEAEVFFPSNLALATPEILEKIVRSRLDHISISLNASNAADYKRIMKLDYKKTIANVKQLIKLRNKINTKLKISLSIAANSINKKSIDVFVKKWQNKVDHIAINWIHSWAGAIKNGAKNSKVRYPCRRLFEEITIQSNGDIPLCAVDYDGKVVGGNVMTDKILDSYYSKSIDKIRKMHRAGEAGKFTMCANCRFSERGMYWWM